MAGAFATQARLFDPAKRCLAVRDHAGVHPHHAVLQRLAHAEDAGHVAAEEVAGQAELGVVGGRNGLGLGLELENRGHRAKDFFTGDTHVAAHIGQHRGLVERPAFDLGRGTAGQHLRALGDSVGHQGLDLVQGLGIDQRALPHALLEAVAHPDLGHAGSQSGHKGVVDAGLHIHAVGAHAGLTRVAVLAGQGSLHGHIQVGIVEHDQGGVAAQLQRQLLDGRRALLHQDAAHLGGAGEGQVAHRVTGAQDLAHLDRALGIGREDVEHARWHAGALGQFGDGQCRQGGGLSRFDDDRATGRQGRGDLARDHGHRKVPGRDGRAHPNGLAQHQQTFGRVGAGDGFAIDAARFLGKPLHEAGTVEHFASGLGQGLALLGGHDARQIVGVLLQQLEPLHQDGRAGLGRQGAPGRPGGVGGGNRRLGLLGPQIGHLGQQGTCCGIGHGEALRSVHPLSVDQSLRLEQGRVLQGGQRGGGEAHVVLACLWVERVCVKPSIIGVERNL